ncbi:hypothetical protein ACFL2C_00435 [Patescibacteria group bacterium]
MRLLLTKKPTLKMLLLPGSPILRLVTPPLIFFFNPIIVTVLSIYFDGADAPFYRKLGFNRAQYELYDKTLDLYWQTIAWMYALVVFPADFLPMLTFLFIYRTFGHIIHYATQNERVFIIFPNLFENLFILLLVYYSSLFGSLINSDNLTQWIGFVFAIKIFQETITHHFDRRLYPYMPDWMKAPDW